MSHESQRFEITQKPWGKEVLLHQGNGYAVKEITLLDGKSTSLHFHNVKHECIYVVSGELTLKLALAEKSDSFHELRLSPGDFQAIKPRFIHQMSSTNGDSIYLESQTDHLDDVIRISDPNNR